MTNKRKYIQITRNDHTCIVLQADELAEVMRREVGRLRVGDALRVEVVVMGQDEYERLEDCED